MKQLFLMATFGLILSASAAAYAATQSVTANISFDSALTLTKNADIQFGTVKAATAGTYTISSAGAVTPSGGGVWLFGTPAAGNITIAGSTTQTVNISVGGYTANGGVTLSNAKCSYNGGAEGSCTITGGAAPGVGKTLLVGVDAVADGTQAGGSTATPSFTVTVVYP